MVYAADRSASIQRLGPNFHIRLKQSYHLFSVFAQKLYRQIFLLFCKKPWEIRRTGQCRGMPFLNISDLNFYIIRVVISRRPLSLRSG